MRNPRDRVAVLVIRVWVEPDWPEPGLRARLTVTPDIADRGAAQEVSSASQIDEICDQVRRFLIAFTNEAQERLTTSPSEPEA